MLIRTTGLVGIVLAGAGLLGSEKAQAQAQAKGQGQALPKPACPPVVPADQALLQPRRIQPDQVQAKNAMGCLSPADAVYGANGCPLRLCGPDAGVIQLPEP